MSTIIRRNNIRILAVCISLCAINVAMVSCHNRYKMRYGLDLISDSTIDSVLVSLDIHSEITCLGELQVRILNSGIDFYVRRWDENVKCIYVNDTIKSDIAQLLSGLLTNKIPVYDLKKSSNIFVIHESDILEITSFCKSKVYRTQVLLGSVYSVEPQITEYGYEIIYNPQFRLLIQYLYYLMATSYDDETKFQFVDLLVDISKEDNRSILYPSQEWINQILTSSSYQSYKKEQEIWLN